MARTANSMVTFQDLDDMVSFEGFSYVTNPITPPSNLNTCATKLDVLGYIDAGLTVTIDDNQLVNYSIIIIALPGITDTLDISPGGFSTNSTTATYTIEVESNTSWSISSGNDWVDISVNGGTGNVDVIITVSENTDPSQRDFTITFITDSFEVTKEHDIIQDAYTGTSIECGGSLIGNGSDGIYEIDAELGTDTGYPVVQFDAQSVPDRFQIIYDGNVVADSLFIGGGLPSSSYEAQIVNVTELDRYVHDGNDFQLVEEDKSVNFSSSDIAVSDGSETRADGSGTGQSGVVVDYPNGALKATYRLIQLTFHKSQAYPTTITIRITGVNTNTQWTIDDLQCP